MNQTTNLRAVRDIVIYGPVACGDCDRIIGRFNDKMISTRKVVVDSNHEVIAKLRPVTGGTVATPVVYVNGHYAFNGPNPAGLLDVINSELALLAKEVHNTVH